MNCTFKVIFKASPSRSPVNDPNKVYNKRIEKHIYTCNLFSSLGFLIKVLFYLTFENIPYEIDIEVNNDVKVSSC